MKLILTVELALIILMLLLGWIFLANRDGSPKYYPSTTNTPLNGACYGTTFMWSNFNMATGSGANYIVLDAPNCEGGKK